ncbi:MAG: DUF1850 domain-containing protein [Burkholderiales bacterium]
MSVAALGVCLALAAQPAAAPVFVRAPRFTLAWTHSIEKVRWEEDYEVALRGGAPALLAVAARVRGSGAGMEPPPGAVLRDGWYEFVPERRVHTDLALTRSAYAADYEFCADGGCRPLSALLPSDGGVTRLSACRAPG